MTAAFRTTALDLATALSGQRRQEVHIVKTTHSNPRSPKYLVLVNNEYYEVFTHDLRALQSGVTPDELDLEPAEDEDEYAEFGGDYASADHFAQLRRSLGER